MPPTPRSLQPCSNRPHAWKYRDYVIRSFNEDKPYARFVAKQLAGDEVDHADETSLDDEQRAVVILRDVEDLSIEEICEITGLPDGTVKSRLHRARLVLRKKLQRHVE